MFDNLFVEYTNAPTSYSTSDFDKDIELVLPYLDEQLGIKEGQVSFAPFKGESIDVWSYFKNPDNTTTTTFNTSNEENNKVTNKGNNKKYVKDWLMTKQGLTNEQASALTAVWYAESRLDPSIHEIGKENNPYAGKGIAQWTGKSRQTHVEDLYRKIYGKSKPIKQMTLEEQLNIAVAEFKERNGNWNKFLQAKDLKTATDIVWRGYENGGNNMLASMQQMQNTYKGNTQRQWNERFRLANEILNI